VGQNGVHESDNQWFMDLPLADLPAGIGTFDEALKTIKIDDYDAAIRAELAVAEVVDRMEVRKADFKFVDGKHYMVPIEYDDCRRPDTMKKAFVEARYVCRTLHRGLFDARIGANSRVYFVDKRAGAEWLPRHMWTPHENLKPLPTYPGETCKALCTRSGYICSSHDAAHVNTCDALQSAVTCKSCGKTKAHRGAGIMPPVDISAERECLVSERAGFFCDDPAPQDTSILCPCIPKHSYFNSRYDYNQQ
jgi:hypothetical protein